MLRRFLLSSLFNLLRNYIIKVLLDTLIIISAAIHTLTPTIILDTILAEAVLEDAGMTILFYFIKTNLIKDRCLMMHVYLCNRLIPLLVIGVIFLLGCSSGGNHTNTVLPDETQPSIDLTSENRTVSGVENNRFLWHFQMIYIDPTNPDDVTYEVIPVRTAPIHLNILKFMEVGPCTDCFKITGITNLGPGHFTIDIEITHPLAEPVFTAFDARVIIMFNGSYNFPTSGLTCSDFSMGDTEFVDPDGYTALYNASTIGVAPNDFFGYFQGKIATPALPSADLNGYRRYITNDSANTRNALYDGDTITQTIELMFGPNPFALGYAVDACWAMPTADPVTDPMTDFPPEANCEEPWKIEIAETGPGLTDQDGSAILKIDVYDWQGKATHGEPVIECPELFNGAKTATWVEDGIDYSRYEVSLTNENLAAAGQYKILIKVVDNENDPIGKPWLDLTAYQIYTIEVASDTVVTFPDPGLELAVRDAISKPTGDIYLSDLIGLTILDAESSSISDIEGIQYCTDLEELWLLSNTIIDISPLAGLVNLTILDLSDNNIVDISPLAGLVNLTYLELSSNNIVDISPLDGLVNLATLYLLDNNIVDISPLDGLVNLTTLYLGDNNIVDISPLDGLVNLTKLHLRDNNIVDISSLDGLVNLTFLNLNDNYIVVIDALVLNAAAGGLGSGDTVWLENNPLNCESLTTHINTLIGNGVTVHYSDPVINFPDANLIAAIIADWGLPGPDIHQSEVCGQTILCAEFQSISDIEGIQYCTDLEQLLLYNNSIIDISPLDGLVNLKTLDLGENEIVDMSPLAGLVNLTTLYLGDNNIVDISPLDGLVNLTILILNDNYIVVIDALVLNAAAGGLGSGDKVYIQYNPLGPDALNNDIPTLINTYGVTVYF